MTMNDECDEIADNMASALTRIPRTFDEALRIVKRRMPDESSQVQDNVAESLLRWREPDDEPRDTGGRGRLVR